MGAHGHMPYVVAVIPAHDEEEGIAATVTSLLRQSFPVAQVVVAADNCTDRTESIAVAAGATVVRTEGNLHRKAGALNQVLERFLPTWAPSTYVLVMDADSVLDPDWVRLSLPWVGRYGAVSGAYEARDADGLLPLLQRVEYASERYRITKKMGRVTVLSGAASIFRADILAQVAASRGSLLPGRCGDYYDPESLTEDFEITLAVQRLGFTTVSPKSLRVVTDVMTTPGALAGQRLRWQRGYLETLCTYPLRQTWRAWTVQLWTYTCSLLPLVMAALVLTSWWVHGLHYKPLWLLLVPLFAGAEAYMARAAGRRGQAVACAVLPLYAYSCFRYGVYWMAVYRALRGSRRAWT